MKVAIYCRVSKEDSDKSSNRYQEPENQLHPLREWAKRFEWQVVEEYIDRGSGADPNRPAFKQMLKDAMLMKFNTILVWKFDRFSREPMFTAVGRVQKLRERNVGIKSLTEEWLDTSKDNPMAEVILSIMAWASAEERRKISQRTKAGIQRRKNLRIYKGGRPRASITDEQKEEAYLLYNKGKSIRAIQRKLKVSRKLLTSILKGGLDSGTKEPVVQ